VTHATMLAKRKAQIDWAIAISRAEPQIRLQSTR